MGKGFYDKVLNPFGLSEGVTTHLTGGPPPASYFGGSPEAMDQTRATYMLGGKAAMNQGIGQSRSGAGMLGDASGYAAQDRNNAYGYAMTGADMGRASGESQDAQINALLAQSRNQGPSQAQALMRGAQDENSRRMMGMAAQARGGNQAAAMRSASAASQQGTLQTNQQLGALRAQEEAQRQQNILGAQQYAAGAYGQRMGLGYGMYGQGLGAAQNSTGQLGQFGGTMGQLGIAQQNVGLGQYGLLNDMNKSQLETDRGWASAATASKSPAAAFGGILGGVTQLWGGGSQG